MVEAEKECGPIEANEIIYLVICPEKEDFTPFFKFLFYKHYVTSIRDQETISVCSDHWFQIRKETEKAFVPKVVISTTKAKEQETRVTGQITTKQEQKQVTQETVSPVLSLHCNSWTNNAF